MIQFNFTLDEIDTHNLFGCLQSEIVDMNERIMDEMCEQNRVEYINYYRNRISYIQELMQKMHHTPID